MEKDHVERLSVAVDALESTGRFVDSAEERKRLLPCGLSDGGQVYLDHDTGLQVSIAELLDRTRVVCQGEAKVICGELRCTFGGVHQGHVPEHLAAEWADFLPRRVRVTVVSLGSDGRGGVRLRAHFHELEKGCAA